MTATDKSMGVSAAEIATAHSLDLRAVETAISVTGVSSYWDSGTPVYSGPAVVLILREVKCAARDAVIDGAGQ